MLRSTPTPPGWRPCRTVAPRLAALTRVYGEDVDAVLAWGQRASARLLELDDDEGLVEQAARRGGAVPYRRRPRPPP
ncbi:hypothetical protein GCM10025868_06000 [Angustibacter aerolatus]|uniref:Uncharacterized protein n=1 Tax=Angustibacter aerolatus TaxID=1162965 RepID=A0ABQ6JAZ4_9ACTN|nr:hypothetical protein GCM10025868_06000 [Angustibacter aerolatus]